MIDINIRLVTPLPAEVNHCSNCNLLHLETNSTLTDS